MAPSVEHVITSDCLTNTYPWRVRIHLRDIHPDVRNVRLWLEDRDIEYRSLEDFGASMNPGTHSFRFRTEKEAHFFILGCYKQHNGKYLTMFNFDINSLYPGQLNVIWAARSTGKSMIALTYALERAKSLKSRAK